jgi:hypothetical protein
MNEDPNQHLMKSSRLRLLKKSRIFAAALFLTEFAVPVIHAEESPPDLRKPKFPDRTELTSLLPTAVVGNADKTRIIGVMQSALKGEELTIMGIGTSIMAGANASDFKKTSLSPLVYDWWVSKFPKAKFNFINAGMGASSAVFAVHRAERDLLKHHPDFTVIDYAGGDRNFEAEGYEGLVRKLLIQRPQSALLSIIQGGQNPAKVPEVHVAICENYGIPILSAPQIFQPLLKSGRLVWQDWSTDTIHPSDAGHAMIADLIISFLEECYQEAATSSKPVEIGGLKAPVTKNGFEKSAVHDAASLVPDDRGGWTINEGADFWRNSWAANAEGKPMVFKVMAKSLIFGYRKTVKPTNGKLIVRMDGKQIKEIDPNFLKGWGDWVPNETVFKTDRAEDHTIEFLYSGSQGEPILIKYLLIAE